HGGRRGVQLRRVDRGGPSGRPDPAARLPGLDAIVADERDRRWDDHTLLRLRDRLALRTRRRLAVPRAGPVPPRVLARAACLGGGAANRHLAATGRSLAAIA